MTQVTSPDNIPSPDLTDQYALTQDMAALADGTQAALVRRANLYIGTSTQRAAFTSAPEGVHWQDTDGDKKEYVRKSGKWEESAIKPPPSARGTVTVRSTGVAGTATITFPAGLFESPPLVFISKQSGALAAFIPYAEGITSTGATVGVYTTGPSNASTVRVAWHAISA